MIAGAPHHVRRPDDLLSLQHRPSVPDTRDPPTRRTPADASSFGFTRMSGPPCDTAFGRDFRPTGVSTVSTR